MHISTSRTLCPSLEIGWERARIRVCTCSISAICPAMSAMAVERHERVPGVRFADWLPSSPPVRADEVNRPRDKGWRLTSSVIRLCGSATMVIERDNEQPDVPAEMRWRNAGFIVATFSEHDSSALRGNSWWCSRECLRATRQRDSLRFECAFRNLYV